MNGRGKYPISNLQEGIFNINGIKKSPPLQMRGEI